MSATAADFKLIMVVNSAVQPTGGFGSVASINPFARAYKPAGYQWAYLTTPASSGSVWNPWPAPDLELDTNDWNPGELQFEIWDTNTTPGTLALTQFAYAVNNSGYFTLPGTPGHPSGKPSMSLVVSTLPAGGQGPVAGTIAITSGTSPNQTNYLGSPCSIFTGFANVSFANVNSFKAPVRVQVAAFFQIGFTPTNSTSQTLTTFTCDPEMILDTI